MYSPIPPNEKHGATYIEQKTRLFRNIRSQITRTMYECECGRRYQTFPALYLHFKRQHSLRISAKAKDQKCSVRELGSFRIVKYFYTLDEYQRFKNGVSEKNIEKIISRFLKQADPDALDKQIAQKCLDELIFDMFDDIFHVMTCQEQELISNLPYRLNSFILERQNILSQLEFGCWCQVLIEFSKWLYQNEFTQVLIELNEEYFYSKIVQK